MTVPSTPPPMSTHSETEQHPVDALFDRYAEARDEWNVAYDSKNLHLAIDKMRAIRLEAIALYDKSAPPVRAPLPEWVEKIVATARRIVAIGPRKRRSDAIVFLADRLAALPPRPEQQ